MLSAGYATTYEQSGAEYGPWGKQQFLQYEKAARLVILLSKSSTDMNIHTGLRNEGCGPPKSLSSPRQNTKGDKEMEMSLLLTLTPTPLTEAVAPLAAKRVSSGHDFFPFGGNFMTWQPV